MSFEMSLDPWLVSALLAFSLVATLGTNWLAARLWPRARLASRSAGAMFADLIWVLLVFAAGLLAVRYIERIDNATLGFVLFGLAILSLSVLRAYLYRRGREGERKADSLDGRQLGSLGIHSLTYILFAIIVFLTISWILRRPADPILFVPLSLGVLLPDLDTRKSLPGRLLPCVSGRLEDRLGAGGAWHSLAAAVLLAALTTPLILIVGTEAWALIPLGYVSHLILDLLTPSGVMLFWPVSHSRYNVMGGPIASPGSVPERWLALGMAIVTVVLLFVADLGPVPAPAPPVPTYEQTVERYRGLRGRNLVYADVEGAWQATGRRIHARFQVLNAIDDSLIMLEPFTGKVFRAGRSAEDHLYLNQISMWPGDSTRIKAIELQIENQPIADALPMLYEMQSEPGLQHIYVSGELILDPRAGTHSPALREDLTQTRLSKVESRGDGRYSLQYLTAGELIELARLEVGAGNLVIVATYATPPAGPTPTPLPLPPAGQP